MSSSNRPNRWAREEDWNRHRDTISHLYIDENNSLKDLIQSMKRDHNFFGTVKMYKSRLSRWGLRKNLTAKDIPDMLQAMPRSAGVAKATEFIVRGRPVDPEKVDRYLKRTFGYENPAAQTSSYDNYQKYCRLQAVSAEWAAAVTQPHSPRWVAPPDAHQFPEQVIYFSKQFIAGTSRWATFDGRGAGNWLSAISTAQHLIHEGHFRGAFSILDRCFENLKSLLLNLDPCLLLRTYAAALSLPEELGKCMLSFVAEIMSITLPREHPMTLAWQKLGRAGIHQAREHAWHIMSSYLTELNTASQQNEDCQELASWTCVYYPVLAQLQSSDMIERYQRKQLDSLTADGSPTMPLHLKLNLAATCIANRKRSEAKLLMDEVYLRAIQKPEAPVQATQDLVLHYRYSEFRIFLASDLREEAIEAGKRLHQALEESFDTWQPWAFLVAAWVRQQFSELGMAEEAGKLCVMLELDQYQIPPVIPRER